MHTCTYIGVRIMELYMYTVYIHIENATLLRYIVHVFINKRTWLAEWMVELKGETTRYQARGTVRANAVDWQREYWKTEREREARRTGGNREEEVESDEDEEERGNREVEREETVNEGASRYHDVLRRCLVRHFTDDIYLICFEDESTCIDRPWSHVVKQLGPIDINLTDEYIYRTVFCGCPGITPRSYTIYYILRDIQSSMGLVCLVPITIDRLPLNCL